MPASIGVARCTGVLRERCAKDTELFGQINAPEIVALEVQCEGAWHRFPVSVQGYIVRLEGFTSVPTAYRWLDADGDVVWIQGFVPSLDPLRGEGASGWTHAPGLRGSPSP